MPDTEEIMFNELESRAIKQSVDELFEDLRKVPTPHDLIEYFNKKSEFHWLGGLSTGCHVNKTAVRVLLQYIYFLEEELYGD